MSTVSSSSPLIEPLIPLFQGVRQALLDQSPTLTAFLSMFRGQTVSMDPNTHRPHTSTVQGLDLELSALLAFFRDLFPQPSVSSPGLWHSVPQVSMMDPTTIPIHGRLAAALSQPQDPRNLCHLRFIVVVIIFHQLAHAVASHFQKGTLSLEDHAYPYYLSCRAPPVTRFPEHGFSVEDDLFGGIVGVMFEDELCGSPPMFFESDFTRISFLFLHCHNGLTYRLGTQYLVWHNRDCRLN